MSRFTGKVALVTGASMGIGEAIARAFSADGARLALAARSLDKLEAVARSLPAEAIAIRADLGRPEDIRAMVEQTVARFGRLDILVNNAAVGMYASVAEMKPEQVEHLVATNWLGPVRAIQAALPHMQRQGGGVIVNISSVAGKVALPWMSAYCASKFALNALSDSLRMELEPDNIHVLSVCPGRIRTAFTENAYKDFATRPLYPGGISAERVARAVVRAVHHRRREIVVPFHNRLFGWLHFFFPAWVDRATVRVLRPQMRQRQGQPPR